MCVAVIAIFPTANYLLWLIIDVGNMVKNNNWDTDDVTKRQYSFGFFIANFGKISWIVMVLVTLTLNK